MYQTLIDRTKEEIKNLEGKDNVSSVLRTQYLKGLQKDLNTILNSNAKELNSLITNNMTSAVQAVIADNKVWLNNAGFKVITSAWSNIPTDIVDTVITGKLYDGKWSLSNSIWKDIKKTQKDINQVIAEGIAQNKSTFDIAKDLEKYVDPMAKKPWNWSTVYPKVKKQIDYNAQRLARTMVSHAYQQGFVQTTIKNPWVSKYKWQSSASERTCELCSGRNGVLFNKFDLPLDHPNGMCTYIAVIPKSNKQIIDDIVNWYKSPEGTYAGIDDFANSL